MLQEMPLVKLNKLAVLQSLFVSGLLVSNIIAAKVIVLWKLELPAAVIIYPFTFLFTDIIGELYGKDEEIEPYGMGFLPPFLPW